jgi:hypothetical protein
MISEDPYVWCRRGTIEFLDFDNESGRRFRLGFDECKQRSQIDIRQTLIRIKPHDPFRGRSAQRKVAHFGAVFLQFDRIDTSTVFASDGGGAIHWFLVNDDNFSNKRLYPGQTIR